MNDEWAGFKPWVSGIWKRPLYQGTKDDANVICLHIIGNLFVE